MSAREETPEAMSVSFLAVKDIGSIFEVIIFFLLLADDDDDDDSDENGNDNKFVLVANAERAALAAEP